MNDPLRRTAWTILAGFLVLALATTWIQAVVGTDYRDDPRNPRVVESRVGRERGVIVSADSVVAAQSDPAPGGQTFERSYPSNEAYAHTVGFVSVLFGARGLEREHASDLVSNRDATIDDATPIDNADRTGTGHRVRDSAQRHAGHPRRAALR